MAAKKRTKKKTTKRKTATRKVVRKRAPAGSNTDSAMQLLMYVTIAMVVMVLVVVIGLKSLGLL